MAAPVTLFGLSRSVYTRIARLALEEKAVPYNLQEVEIFASSGVPADHLIRHPFGRIPALAHGEFSLYETQAICRYVDEAFPGPTMQPGSPASRARMNQVIGLLDSYAYRPMVWGVFVERVRKPLRGERADEELISTSMRDVHAVLAALSSLAGAGPFLAGPSLTLADLHAYPMLAYLALAPERRDALTDHEVLARWQRPLSDRPSVRNTVTEYE